VFFSQCPVSVKSRALSAGRLQSGFTLLELLVVLVVAAIAVSVVGGGAQSFMDRARYHQTVRDISRHLHQARALCVQEGRAVLVTYQPVERQLLIDGHPQLQIPESVVIDWEAAAHPPKNATNVGELIFAFNSDGGARGGALTVERGGRGVVFRVNWLLGSIEQAAKAPKS